MEVSVFVIDRSIHEFSESYQRCGKKRYEQSSHGAVDVARRRGATLEGRRTERPRDLGFCRTGSPSSMRGIMFL